jgi:hypothetical protein
MKSLGSVVILALWITSGSGYAEGTHRGINMDVNRTGYHMIVVIDKHVSIVDDKTEQECATSARFLRAYIPEAWICCYHTQDQRKAC